MKEEHQYSKVVAAFSQVKRALLEVALTRSTPNPSQSLSSQPECEQEVVTPELLSILSRRIRHLPHVSDTAEDLVIQPIIRSSAADALFLVHPGGGQVSCYAELALHHGATRRVFGVQSPALSSNESPLESVEEMAQRYLASVKKVAPKGRCAFAGWSIGALIAYEMALHSIAISGGLQAVVLIDPFLTRPEDVAFKNVSQIEKETGTFVGFMREFVTLSTSAPVPKFATLAEEVAFYHYDPSIGIERTRLMEVFTFMRQANIVSQHVEFDSFYKRVVVYRANYNAAVKYQPKESALKAALFLPDASSAAERERQNRFWGDLMVKGVNITVVEGNHYSMMSHRSAGQIGFEMCKYFDRASV